MIFRVIFTLWGGIRDSYWALIGHNWAFKLNPIRKALMPSEAINALTNENPIITTLELNFKWHLFLTPMITSCTFDLVHFWQIYTFLPEIQLGPRSLLTTTTPLIDVFCKCQYIQNHFWY
jgi:hypothetical protein